MAFEQLADNIFDTICQTSGGDTFTIGSLTGVKGIKSQIMERDPIRGLQRKTLITVRKSSLTTWPTKGTRITHGGNYWKVSEVVPGDVDNQVIIECESTVKNSV